MPMSRGKLLSKEDAQTVVGAAVRTLREDKGLTQLQLAELAELHLNYVGLVERGERNISLHNILKLAKALDVRVADLMAGFDRE
jgi:transcriptional regulator with XRE-family HTH domain